MNTNDKTDTTQSIYKNYAFDSSRINIEGSRSYISDHFRQKYVTDEWFTLIKNNNALKAVRLGFTLATKQFLNLSHTRRSLVKAIEERELYTVYDRYKTVEAERPNIFLRIYTHVFCNVEAARIGFFYLLWGAELLKGRNEGIPAVGEISYGLDNYLCFIRNNVVIRISVDSVEPTDIHESFAKQIDQQVCDNLV